MEIKCPSCGHKIIIPDERLLAFKANVTVPCSGCEKDIEIDFKTKRTSAASIASAEKLSGEALKKTILKSVDNLPPMPQVAQKARRVISNPDSSFEDLAKVIETDQAIATTVLKLANSAYYGSAGTVSSVQRASVILGTKTLMELLTLACAGGPLGRILKGYDLESGDLWKHSLAVAACSKSIAKNRNPDLAEDAFSAGLIHDVGKLILDPYIFERKEAFERFVQEGKESFLNAEEDILGFSHGEMAAGICDKWRIPENLSIAIRYHHNPLKSDGNVLAYILHVADVIAMMTGIGGGLDGMLYRIEDTALDFLKFDHTEIPLLMGEVVEFVEKTVGGA